MNASAAQVGHECLALFSWSELFPAVSLGTGSCAYHHAATITETVCDLATFPDVHLNRVCACEPDAGAQASGDPHLVNMLGRKFDINREGINVFLMYPRARPRDVESHVKLRVDALITHSKQAGRCNGWYITKLWVNGLLIGDEITITARGNKEHAPDALEVKIGERVVANTSRSITKRAYNLTVTDTRGSEAKAHIHHKLKFAVMTLAVVGGPTLEFEWFGGKHSTNNLNMKAARLRTLGKDWGGLLGVDDSVWASSFDHECASRDPYGLLEQLIGNPNSGAMASATLK